MILTTRLDFNYRPMIYYSRINSFANIGIDIAGYWNFLDKLNK